MTYRAVRLDPEISAGAQGGPNFVTAVSTNESGDESRESTLGKGLGRWTISYVGKRPAWWGKFLDFFYVMGGRRDTWGFRDWLDYTCTQAESHVEAAGDDSPATEYQMYKRRTVGAYTYDQKIILPLNGTVTVYGGGSYTISYTTGIITVVSGAAPTGFVCEFDKLCRFDTDHLVQTLEFRKNDTNRTIIVSYAGIPIFEVPLSAA